MTNTTPDPLDRLSLSENAERQIALEYVADAWNTAEADGVASEAMAHAALFAALAILVREHGCDGAAAMVDALPARIRAGEYDLTRSLQ